MNKISKWILSPLPVVGVLPTIAFATSCNTLDFTKALDWYTIELAKAQPEFDATNPDPTLKQGLSNVAEIERLFIENKVQNYWLQTVVNFRKDKYNESHGVAEELCEAWDVHYGHSNEERKLYQKYKEDHSAEWLQIVGSDALVVSCSKQVAFYQALSVLNGYVAERGDVLLDLIGWATHVVEDANNKLIQLQTDVYPITLFYGDVDGANVGYIYSQLKTPYKSPTLALYKYYTQYTKIEDKLTLYREKVLGIDPSWDDDQIFEHLYTKLCNNFYLLQYAEFYTDIKFDKEDHQLYIGWAVQNFIKRLKGGEA